MSACSRRVTGSTWRNLHIRRSLNPKYASQCSLLPKIYTSQHTIFRSTKQLRKPLFPVSERKGICLYAIGDQSVAVGDQTNRTVEIAVSVAVTVVLGVANRVLYKLALVPLKHYPFFLAQLATFGYVIVYCSILYFRYHAGLVTDEMLSMPKTLFIAVGLLEALAAASGMAAGAILSGAAIPILSQSFLVWQLLLSYIFLGRRYRFNQLLGCFLVAAGVVITVSSGSSAGSLMKVGIFWSILMIGSFLLQAGDTILKEMIFLDADQHVKGGSVDLFVVNSFGSAYQVCSQENVNVLLTVEQHTMLRHRQLFTKFMLCRISLTTIMGGSHKLIQGRSKAQIMLPNGTILTIKEAFMLLELQELF